MSRIEDSVINQIKMRAIKGEMKYNTTMERNDLSLIEWLQHLQEELLDAAVYVEKLKQEVNYTDEIDPDIKVNYEVVPPCSGHNAASEEEELLEIAEKRALEGLEAIRERRMNIIGQNGNDGLHYDSWAGIEGLTLNINGATVTSTADYFIDKGNWANKNAIQKAQQQEDWACNTHPFQD